MKLYVGNLAFETTASDLSAAFGEHGEVQDATVITDRETGNSRGFGFVEMPDNQAAQNAMKAMDGAELSGRQIKVNEARPRNDNRGGGGGGGGRGGGGGGGSRRSREPRGW